MTSIILTPMWNNSHQHGNNSPQNISNHLDEERTQRDGRIEGIYMSPVPVGRPPNTNMSHTAYALQWVPQYISEPLYYVDPRVQIQRGLSYPSYPHPQMAPRTYSEGSIRLIPSPSFTDSPMDPVNVVAGDQQGQKCTHCGRFITRDLARHMRIHEPVSRFKCLYPREMCPHKSGFFNRQYDFKKHLLHCHFVFNDPKVKRFNSLTEKLDHEGWCSCGRVMTAREFLANHIMEKDEHGQFRCSNLKAKWDRCGTPEM